MNRKSFIRRLKKYPDYGVTSWGTIVSFKFGNEKKLKTRVSKGGYERLKINGKTLYVHIEVAKAFILNPQNKPEVNHKNGNKLDNRFTNLEWCTRQENVIHMFLTMENLIAKITVDDVRDIRSMIAKHYTDTRISIIKGVSTDIVKNIRKKKTWKFVD